MGFLKRNKNKRKNGNAQSNAATKPSPWAKHKAGWFGFKPHKTTSVTYTETIAPSSSNVSHYTAISTAELSIVQNDTMATQDLIEGKRNVFPTSMMKHTSSFDRKVVETEENIRRQILMATSSDSQDGNVRLQTSGGVLAFDGLECADDDDASLAEVMRKEKEERMLQNGEVETAFVVAPKHYDPVASGFYSPKQKGSGCDSKSWYEDDEPDLASRTVSSSKSYASNSAMSRETMEDVPMMEPSIEVVINQKSYLQRL